MDSNDPRAVRSREALTDALIDLALEQGYDNLTVRAVTKHAKVGYATFFRQFKSLDELLAHILHTAFYEVDESMSRQQTLYDEALVLYSNVREHPHLYRLYLNLPLSHPVRRPLMAKSQDLIRARLQRRPHTHAPLALSVDHILQTTNRLVAWYLDHLSEYTPDQLAAIHYDFIIAGTQSAVSIRPGRKKMAPASS